MCVKNKTILVTGSARGIGAAIVRRFAEAGAQLIINDLDESSAQTLAEDLSKQGTRAISNSFNVSRSEDVKKMMLQIKTTFGRLDCVINNAGITRDGLLLKLSEEKWDEVIAVNLKGVFNVGQAAAQIMSEQKSGIIINIASISWLGNIGQTNYSAAKAGVVAMTNVWALELARYGIRVNAIAPGFIDTVLTQQVPEEIRTRFISRIPLKRFGQTQDIAELAYFLTSDASKYITGQCIHIDGGLTTGLGSL